MEHCFSVPPVFHLASLAYSSLSLSVIIYVTCICAMHDIFFHSNKVNNHYFQTTKKQRIRTRRHFLFLVFPSENSFLIYTRGQMAYCGGMWNETKDRRISDSISYFHRYLSLVFSVYCLRTRETCQLFEKSLESRSSTKTCPIDWNRENKNSFTFVQVTEDGKK